jgi:hypothetical protein
MVTRLDDLLILGVAGKVPVRDTAGQALGAPAVAAPDWHGLCYR